MFPRQTTTDWNGVPYGDETAQRVTIDEAADDARFEIPDAVRAAFGKTVAVPEPHVDAAKAIALTDWLVEILGTTTSRSFTRRMAWSSSKARQPVRTRARSWRSPPRASGRARQGRRDHVRRVAAHRRAARVRRAWHSIYLLDLNVPIVTRLVDAPHTIAPDALQKSPRKPGFRPVSERTVIGSGETRLEVVPVRGEVGERMMIAWLPGAHALHPSDLIQRTSRTGAAFFMPSMPLEVQKAVTREGITGVDRVFGMTWRRRPGRRGRGNRRGPAVAAAVSRALSCRVDAFDVHPDRSRAGARIGRAGDRVRPRRRRQPSLEDRRHGGFPDRAGTWQFASPDTGSPGCCSRWRSRSRSSCGAGSAAGARPGCDRGVPARRESRYP